MRLLIVLLLGMATVWDGAAQTAQLLTRDQPYRLQPSDVLQVEYVFTPEYNQEAPVEPDGTVRLKLIGSVKVVGLTLDQATAAIVAKASVPLKDPEVTLTLKEFVKPHYTVSGMVEHPGVYDIHGNITLMQAIAVSGGLKETAKDSQVLLVRKVNDELAEVKVVNAKAMGTPKGALEDFSLRPGDMVIVPKNRLGKIEPYVRVTSMAFTALYGVQVAR
jgi:protein involved in polysaccharide export with SLBB domain